MIKLVRGKVKLLLEECDYALVKEAIGLLLSEINNDIVTCPAPLAFKEELLVLENKRTRLMLLKESIK